MRLGQLARQLGITTDKIVNFLASRDVSVENGNNARIDDSHVDMVLQHFAPGNEALKEQVSLSPDSQPFPEAEFFPSEIEPDAESLPEVIKAPKIELPGLRVLGKIELPEKKKLVPEKEDESEKATPPPNLPRRPQKKYPVPERKNPVMLAREREENEMKRKREEEKEREKQRKKEYYEKRLKPQAPTKAVRKLEEEYEEMPPMEPDRPKTLWGRFMRWLTT